MCGWYSAAFVGGDARCGAVSEMVLYSAVRCARYECVSSKAGTRATIRLQQNR